MFESFFFAGFEGTAGWNRAGEWIDQIVATQHDVFVEQDYARLREVGLLGARESARWPLIDRRGCFDFATLMPFVRASRRHGIPVLWDLFHFGYPPDADLFADTLPARFAEYCYAVTRFLVVETDGPLAITPVNEPSYFAWAAGDQACFAPHCRGRGPELKRQLARAAIAGVDAIRDACPSTRIVSVDPICRVAAPLGCTERRADVDGFNSGAVFESWDMIAGRLAPELGGSRDHLGTLGINYYWTNQWELGSDGTPLGLYDPRRVSLATLVHDVWQRYGGDVLITETSHVDNGRAGWLAEVADQTEALLASDLPLGGVCLYPILGMPEWHEPAVWTRMGLWDLHASDRGLERVIHRPMLDTLRDVQHLYWNRHGSGSPADVAARAQRSGDRRLRSSRSGADDSGSRIIRLS